MNKESNLAIRIEDLPFDPCELSKKWLIVVMFLQSRSSNYKEAVSIAGSATYFQQIIIEGKQINLAGFDKTHKDISKFMTLQGLIYGWKGTRFFAGGRPLANPYSCNETLNCYLLSLSCRNIEAYCFQVVNHPFYKDERLSSGGLTLAISIKPQKDNIFEMKEKPPPLLLKPCKRLEAYGLSRYHPSDIIDQVQSMAVELNIDWCPNFKPEATKTIER